jgi:hypothetical protein
MFLPSQEFDVDPVQATPTKPERSALTAAVLEDSPEPADHAHITATPEPYRKGDRRQGLGAIPVGGIQATPVPTHAARASLGGTEATPDAQNCVTAPRSRALPSAARALVDYSGVQGLSVPEEGKYMLVGGSASPDCPPHTSSTSTAQAGQRSSPSSQCMGQAAQGSAHGTPAPHHPEQSHTPLGTTPSPSPDTQVRRLFSTVASPAAPAPSPLVLSKALVQDHMGLGNAVGLVDAEGPPGAGPASFAASGLAAGGSPQVLPTADCRPQMLANHVVA